MSKNIVICCDGTSNNVSSDTTNVLRMYRSLERSERQLAWYDGGVGTLADPTEITAWGKFLSRKLDMAMGHSVRENVCKAYRFLCRSYEPGDRIFLFGFSRGAYTVRALAGMVHFAGLVRPELEGLDRLAWVVYANDHQDLPIAKRFESGARFKKSFGIGEHPRLHFVGVWDTVSTFGFMWNLRTVPYSANNPSIDHARHAVSIDEHRAAFQPNLFRPKQDASRRDLNWFPLSFKQIWFAGAHADVGGGYSEADNGLAKIALQWMYREAENEGCLILPDQKDHFLGEDDNKISKPDVEATAHNSTDGLWHLLEWFPRKQWDHEAERMRWFLPNVYRRRKLPPDAVLHVSVRDKLAEDDKYRPSNLPQELRYGD